MNSCLYEGSIRHRRHTPLAHAFSYRLFMLYLDLDELPGLFDRRWFWSARRPAPAWFRRSDYLGDAAVPLDQAVRSLVEERTGRRPTGPIRLLTHLRYYGLVMNPVSFYYCFDADGETVDTIVAEITNTPWGERHAYVLAANRVAGRSAPSFRVPKEFHVSPFMEMDLGYDWRFSVPGSRLAVSMKNLARGGRIFDATLALERRALSGRSMAGVLLRFPWMTMTVAAGIYWQAFRLWLKGAPFHAHPQRRRTDGAVDIVR